MKHPEEIQAFLHGLRPYELEKLNVSESLLLKMKKSKEVLLNTPFKTVITINDYIETYEKHLNKYNRTRQPTLMYVGVDIGKQHVVTATDELMFGTYINDKDKELEKWINIYHKAYKSYYRLIKNKTVTKDDKKEFQKIKSKFYSILQKKMGKIVDDLFLLYPNGTTFCVGDCDTLNENEVKTDVNNDSTHIVLKKVFIQTLKGRIKQLGFDDSIYEVGEWSTSIRCPRCHSETSKNRDIERNTFHCTKCGYEHPCDDIVAGLNIIRSFRYNRETINYVTILEKFKK